MNMAYCRFQNTLQDLEDCFDHIRDTNLSENEQRARERLIELCALIVNRVEDTEMNQE